MLKRFWGCLLCLLTSHGTATYCQGLKPGLPGMAPSRWITIRNTQAPGRAYAATTSPSKTYTQEDFYFKMWLPVLLRPRFGLIIGPHYRTEQLELKREGGANPAYQLSNWHLRAMGIDLKSSVKLDSTSWLLFSAQVNQSGTLRSDLPGSIPLNYTLTSVYLQRKSTRKEVGYGVMVNKSYNLSVLPVFIYNYNFSDRTGIEMSLPHRIAARYNATPKDIFYAKSEAVTRTYYVTCPDKTEPETFRRVEVDMGVAYNRQLTGMLGVELFAGYRRNLSLTLPEGVIPIKTSGPAMSFEIYLRPPTGVSRKLK